MQSCIFYTCIPFPFCTMVYGVPFREYFTTICMAFGSLILGSQCVHLYMRPQMEIQAEDHMQQFEARRLAIRRVQDMARPVD